MLQVASVLCTVLALSCALPHHKWHWSRPDHHSAKTAAKAQDHEWHWNKHQFTANSHLQSLTATVQDASVLRENACESVVGRLDQNGVNIRRSYHLCSQENPEPELEDVVGTLMTHLNEPSNTNAYASVLYSSFTYYVT